MTARLAGLWLIVSAILAHAMLPTGSAIQRGSGSAFSATTADVTTIPRRERDKDRAETGQAGDSASAKAAGDGGAAILAEAVPVAAAPTAFTGHAWRAPAQAPPTGAPSSFQARAPPALLFTMA